MCVVGLLTGSVEASHFRFGNLSWRQINPTNELEVEITIIEAWRKTLPGLGALRYNFGDGSGSFDSIGADQIADLTDVGGEDYLVYRKTVTHTYPAPGVYQMSASVCCRIFSLQNASSSSLQLGMTIDLRKSNRGSPIVQIPAIIQMVAGTNNTIQLPILDPDGDSYSVRMSSSLESLIPSLASITTGSTTNELKVSPTGLLEWDTTGGAIGAKYAVQLTIEEKHQFSGVGQVPLDFIIELTDASANNPPTCTSPSTNVFSARAGELFTFSVTAVDPDGDDLEMDVLGPAGYVTSPPANTIAASPMGVQFVWTPPHSLSNQSQFVSFIFRDTGGLQAVCPFTINVLPGDGGGPAEPLPPPDIVGHPLSHVALVSSNTTFEVTATSDSPMTYQWFRDETALAAGTNSLLLLTNLSLADSGLYHVTVANTNGASFSRSAVLTVIERGDLPTIIGQPESITNAFGQFVSFYANVVGRPTLLYQWRHDGVPINGAENAALYIFNIKEANKGDYDVIVHNAYGTVTSQVARLEAFEAQLATVQSSPLSRTVMAGADVTFSVAASSPLPLTYEWMRNNTVIGGANGTNYTLTNVGLADAAAYRVRVSNIAGPVLTTAAILTVWQPPVIGEHPHGFTATNTAQEVTLVSTASGFPQPSLHWYRDGIALTNGVGYFGVNSTRLIVPAASMNRLGTYQMMAFSSAGTQQSYSAVLDLDFPPSVLTPPLSSVQNVGAAHGLGVVLTGATPLAVQWFRNGITMPNESAELLSFTNLNRYHAGQYHVVVTNRDGAVTSAVAHLKVNVPQRMMKPEFSPSGFRVRFGDVDGGGLSGEHLAAFRVQTSGDLRVWDELPVGLTVSNGQVFLKDGSVTNLGLRFYRVLEQ